jgi:Type ISP C-terminal specificity domain
MPGIIGNVPREVWDYSIGGKRVIESWFRFRLRERRGAQPKSELDTMSRLTWTSEYGDDLLNLLNAIGRCVLLEPKQEDLLDRICTAPMMSPDAVSRSTDKKSPVPRVPRQPVRQAAVRLPRL